MMNPTKFGSLNKLLYVAAAQSSSHYPGEMMIRIDSYTVEELFLTQTQTYLRQGSFRLPLVQVRYTFRGFAQRRTIRDDQLLGRSGPACPWAHVWLPAHPYYHSECTLLQNGAQPELSYSASWS